MPDDGFACVFHFDGEIAVGGAADEVVVAHGPVAVEAETVDVDDEDVAGHGGLDEEGASLWIAAHDALLAVEVVASGVDGGGVDGVAGIDGEDGLVEGRELAVEDSGGELVAFGCGGGALWTLGGCEGVGDCRSKGGSKGGCRDAGGCGGKGGCGGMRFL